MDAGGLHTADDRQNLPPTTPLKPIVPRAAPICAPVHLNLTPRSGSATSSTSLPQCLSHGFHQSLHWAKTIFDGCVSSSEQPQSDITTHRHFGCGSLMDLTDAGSAMCSGGALTRTSDIEKPVTSVFQYNAKSKSSDMVLPNPSYSRQKYSTEPEGLKSSLQFSRSILTFAPTTPEKGSTRETPMVQIGESKLLDKGAGCRDITDNHDHIHGGSLTIDLNETVLKTPRRRKHRPKVVAEGKTRRGPKQVIPKTDDSNKKPTTKRVYIRRKEVNKSETTSQTEITTQATDSTKLQPTKKSCRRSLNFDIGGQHIDESSACKPDSRLSCGVQVERIQLEQRKKFCYGIEDRIEEETEGISFNLNYSLNHMSETQVQNSAPKKRNPSRSKRNANSLKDANGVEITAHLHVNTAKRMSQTDTPPSGLYDFRMMNSTSSTKGLVRRHYKRKHAAGLEHADTVNSFGSYYNELTAYQAVSVPFANIQHRKSRVKGCSSVTSMPVTSNTRLACCSQNLPVREDHASNPSCSFSGPESEVTKVPILFEGETNLQNKLQSPRSILTLSKNDSFTEKRISRIAKVCDLNSSTRFLEFNSPLYFFRTCQQEDDDKQRVENIGRQHTCIDKQAAGTHTTQGRRKRNKIIFSQNSPSSSSHYPPTAAPTRLLEWMIVIVSLTEKFTKLVIREVSHSTNRENDALVLYGLENQEQNAIVQYKRDGTIVPFSDSLDPIRKRKTRPKVDLDDETNRVWKLLMDNTENPGIDGTDEEKVKWWEKEREVFQGRADSFIARMHLIQGNRCFTPWKGSVVDSVVGVFLTQNVSDHLSSSAFMSLSAHFPLKSRGNSTFSYEHTTNLHVKEPEVHVQEPDGILKCDEKVRNRSISQTSSIMPSDMKTYDENEFVNSSDYRYSSNVISLSNEDNFGRRSFCRTEDVVLSQNSAISFPSSRDSNQNAEKVPCSDRISDSEDLSGTVKLVFDNGSYGQLLETTSTKFPYEVNCNRRELNCESYKHVYNLCNDIEQGNIRQNMEKLVAEPSNEASIIRTDNYTLSMIPAPGVLEVHNFEPLRVDASSQHSNNTWSKLMEKSGIPDKVVLSQNMSSMKEKEDSLISQEENNNIQQSILHKSAKHDIQKSLESSTSEIRMMTKECGDTKASTAKSRWTKTLKIKSDNFDWDALRKKAQANGRRERTEYTMDSVDWEAIRCANVNDIAEAIRGRGMNNRLAERIQVFLNRVYEDHGSIDLEWLRDVEPDLAKEYLLSIRGLGLKSVECLRLLTLHHDAFPVDINVGRIAVRLGWVPLQPLPESLQLHLLELYPVLESIQKYLWPRLRKLKRRKLYELHYQLITFGKVYCTKIKPNCNACPMRGECKHFASAFTSARLALPGPVQGNMANTANNRPTEEIASGHGSQLWVSLPQSITRQETRDTGDKLQAISGNIEPIIEEPASPEAECQQILEHDIEDVFRETEIPAIKLDIEEFTLNLQNFMQNNMDLQEVEMSKALVALTPEVAAIPRPKLKNVRRLRTEHYVYELPDSHPLLEGLDNREPDDPGKYLLAIWTPGETQYSIELPETKCSSTELGKLCSDMECFSCNNIRETNSEVVRGTLLIPCRTAMRGSFPLNGTYFQTNEVFADHDSSLDPINVPRSYIWNLRRRIVYFGTSISMIFKDASTEQVQACFWKGYVCVRGFERKTGAPRPLIARLHLPPSRLNKTKGKTHDE